MAAGAAGAVVAGALIVALAVTGESPSLRNYDRFEPDGIVALAPADVTRVEIGRGDRLFVFTRGPGGTWTAGDGAQGPVSAAEAKHINLGLRFLHVSKPTRTFAADETGASAPADFGLAPPALMVSVSARKEAPVLVAFGALNPAGTGRYARVMGRSGLYLLPLHVGGEWDRVAALAARRLHAGARDTP